MINNQPVYPSNCNPIDFAISKDNNTAYVSSYFGGIDILNITDKANPTLIGKYNPNNIAITSLRLLTDNTTLIGTHLEGLQVINVFNKTNPTLIGEYVRKSGTGGYREFIVSANENQIYAAGANIGMDELSIANLNSPVLLGRYYDVVNQHAPQVKGIAINKEETRAFVGMETGGLRVVGLNEN